MNKTKKIAMAVVATVMAGTMAIPLAACNPEEGRQKVDLGEAWKVLDASGNIDYSVYTRETPVTLNIAIGHNSNLTSTSFKGLGGQITLPDNVTYEDGNMKPAWVQMGKDLNITWNDVYNNFATNANITKIVAGEGAVPYAQTDMFTTDLSLAVDQAAAGTPVLNLGDYLDYMPNFKAFLEANPVVYLSLLQAGMDTTTGENKTIYVAPYFDGNDDIERYCIIRQDWATKLLDGDALTGGTELGTISATGWMQTTGTLEVSVTKVTGTGADVAPEYETVNGKQVAKTAKITKNYDAVVKALKGETTTAADAALKSAFEAIKTSGYTGTSGNIVDVMNAAGATATGSQLAALFRAYVDVCYGGHYDGRRADLFNGYDAAWDVDDLVAILRCVKTNSDVLAANKKGSTTEKKTVYGIAPRSGENDRTPDMVRLAAQLYGVRGADSRYEYTYIDNEGNLQDARNDKALYVALENFNNLKKEGLVADYSGVSSFKNTGGLTDTTETFMLYDYSQTQTLNGFYAEDKKVTGVDVPKGYFMAPIMTPVSKWDVNGNGTIDSGEIFRFTESWRSTKTSGLALNGELAYNRDKLVAALQFVDYLYSADGQIVSTYGPMANAEGKNGFWYNTEATQQEVTDGKYFTYKGVKYSGSDYKGNTTPTITQNVYNSFKGLEVNGYKLNGEKNTVGSAKLSFTNYARMLIGSTLPVGVKDQSFENQLTSQMGQTGAGKVGVALTNGVVKGLSLNIDSNNWWYTCVPTGLPVASNIVKNVLGNADQNTIKYWTGTAKTSGKKDFYSIFSHIILNGVSGTYTQQDQNYALTTIDALVTTMSENNKGQLRENTLNSGWTTAKTYWTYLSAQN